MIDGYLYLIDLVRFLLFRDEILNFLLALPFSLSMFSSLSMLL